MFLDGWPREEPPLLGETQRSCRNGKLPDKVCKFLDSKNVPPDKQKGCRRGSQGTKDQLYINKIILREGKMRKKNLVMGCIDYKKACIIILHTWILECLELFGAAWQLTKKFPEGLAIKQTLESEGHKY